MTGRPGSHRRWANLRARYAQDLPAPCWRCGTIIFPDEPWHLGHLTNYADGGTELDGLAPEHAQCSWRSGGQLGAWRQAVTANPTPITNRRRRNRQARTSPGTEDPVAGANNARWNAGQKGVT